MNDQVSKDLELYKLFILQDDLNSKQDIEQKYNLSNLSSEVVIYALSELLKGKCQLGAVVDYIFGEVE